MTDDVEVTTNTGMATVHPTSVRLETAAIRRIEALIPLLQKTPYGEVARLTRSKILRIAVLRGLDALEADVSTKSKAK